MHKVMPMGKARATDKARAPHCPFSIWRRQTSQRVDLRNPRLLRKSTHTHMWTHEHAQRHSG